MINTSMYILHEQCCRKAFVSKPKPNYLLLKSVNPLSIGKHVRCRNE